VISYGLSFIKRLVGLGFIKRFIKSFIKRLVVLCNPIERTHLYTSHIIIMENREYSVNEFRRRTKEEKVIDSFAAIIDKMFEIGGHTTRYKDVVGRKDAWYQEWEMTLEQNEMWKAWGIDFLKRELKMNQRQASIEMGMISMNWGLTISDWKADV